MKIVVRGTTACLYVNNAQQPALVVNDLKNPSSPGDVALWVGPEAHGWFSKLTVTPQ